MYNLVFFFMQKITIWLENKIKGKARPRFNIQTGTTYHSADYRKFKSELIFYLQSLELPKFDKPVHISCLFVNFFTSDSDNLQGSITDALVQAGVIKNDGATPLPKSSGEFVTTIKKRGVDKEIGVIVEITEVQSFRTINLNDFEFLHTSKQPKVIEVEKIMKMAEELI